MTPASAVQRDDEAFDAVGAERAVIAAAFPTPWVVVAVATMTLAFIGIYPHMTVMAIGAWQTMSGWGLDKIDFEKSIE